MKFKYFILMCILGGAILLAALLIETPKAQDIREQPALAVAEWRDIGEYKYDPTHEQEVWIYVLEWCESRGKKTVVNAKDRDGTPSYYSFQFKPKTFRHYATKYELLRPNLEDADYMNHLSDYDLMREIVRRMVGDKDVMWEQEFPDCVCKFGRPPKAS